MSKIKDGLNLWVLNEDDNLVWKFESQTVKNGFAQTTKRLPVPYHFDDEKSVLNCQFGTSICLNVTSRGGLN